MSGFRNMKFRVSGPEQIGSLCMALGSLGYVREYCASGRGVVITYEDRTYDEYDDEGFETYSGEEMDTSTFIAAHTQSEKTAPPAKFLEDAFDGRNTGSLEDALSEPVQHSGPWMENTGTMPSIDVTTKADLVFFDEMTINGTYIDGFDWGHVGKPNSVVKWRYHRAEDYYKQPRTAGTPAKPSQKESSGVYSAVYDPISGVQTAWEPVDKRTFEVTPKPTIDSHYDFTYTLTEADKLAGKIKVDPYFVAQQWKLGSKDDTGVVFHALKTIARFGDKNTKEREINALHKSIIRLAQLEGVELK